MHWVFSLPIQPIQQIRFILNIMEFYKACFVSLLLFFTISSLHVVSQSQVSGFVSDYKTGEKLIGAHVFAVNSGKALSVDNNGYFSYVNSGDSLFHFSFTGYSTQAVKIDPLTDTTLHILLKPGKEIKEVVVKAHIKQQFNMETLSTTEINSLPSLSGKPDIMKAAQMLPGINTQTEGSSLVLVRGGNPGENLYLFDNVSILYVNHLGGFTSIFNPDMINSIQVYKGGFPSRFGGKLSSVFDITQQEGNTSKLKGSLSLGITDASFSIDGPTKLKNTSFIITGRKSMIDAIMAGYTNMPFYEDYSMFYGFHDINGKFSWRPNLKNSLHVNFYQGDDYLRFWNNSKENNHFTESQKFRMTNIWGNLMSSINWKHNNGRGLFINSGIAFNHYRLKDSKKISIYSQEDTINTNEKYRASVTKTSFYSDWKYTVKNKWKLNFGLQEELLSHNPNYFELSNGDISNPGGKDYHLNTSLYMENSIDFFSNSKARIGVRATLFSKKKVSLLNFAPRISIDFGIAHNQNINVSYMRVNQYGHLLFTQGNIMNNEIWIGADEELLPSHSDQFSLGWNNSLPKYVQLEINAYYKTLQNLATLQEGYTSIAGDENWKNKIAGNGMGNAKGIEISLNKKSGDWTGFINYTFSKANRQFYTINNGKKYTYEYDRPHVATIAVSRNLGEKWKLNLTWTYQSGRPFTPAIGRQYSPWLDASIDEDYNYETLIYGEKNSARMKPYHRMDISAQYHKKTKQRQNDAIWTFSIYNLYNRKNPYYYYYNTSNSDFFLNQSEYGTKPLKLYQMSLFPIIPSVSYRVFFGSGESKLKKKNRSFKNWLYHVD